MYSSSDFIFIFNMIYFIITFLLLKISDSMPKLNWIPLHLQNNSVPIRKVIFTGQTFNSVLKVTVTVERDPGMSKAAVFPSLP